MKAWCHKEREGEVAWAGRLDMTHSLNFPVTKECPPATAQRSGHLGVP